MMRKTINGKEVRGLNKQAGIVVFEMVGWIGLILSIIGLIGVFVFGIGWISLAFGTVLEIGSYYGKKVLKEEGKKKEKKED